MKRNLKLVLNLLLIATILSCRTAKNQPTLEANEQDRINANSLIESLQISDPHGYSFLCNEYKRKEKNADTDCSLIAALSFKLSSFKSNEKEKKIIVADTSWALLITKKADLIIGASIVKKNNGSFKFIKWIPAMDENGKVSTLFTALNKAFSISKEIYTIRKNEFDFVIGFKENGNNRIIDFGYGNYKEFETIEEWLNAK